MAKNKLSTPAWIIEGYDSEADYNKKKGIKIEKKAHCSVSPKLQNEGAKKSDKIFKVRECPECGSDDVGIAMGEIGVWKCNKCDYKGKDIQEKELTEDEFMKYLDEKGEEVA
jgi:ribosomal protein L37AE/L43A